MYASEIRKMTDEQILDRYEDLKEQTFTLRRQFAAGELKDTSLFRKARQDIARLKTILKERELAAMVASEEIENE